MMDGLANINLEVWKYPTDGYLQNTYSPLRVLVDDENNIIDFNVNVADLNMSDVKNIIFECQPSYDGTVNLIFNDDSNPPRVINTRFTKKEDNTFKVINRIQSKQSNLYNIGMLDNQTRLINNVNKFPIIDLLGVYSGGQLKGGMYTIYIKYVDSDYNESPIVSESGQISVFHGVNPHNCSGTLGDELTNKSIRLWIRNLDTNNNSVKLYCVRNYSDISGARLTEAFEILDSYKFNSDELEIVLNGYESIQKIDIAELNIAYQSVSSVKTQAQVQNMLFFGNVEKNIMHESDLQNCSYFIKVALKQSDNSIGYVSSEYTPNKGSEYYDTDNIYYKLGYWPGEYYRLGIVYIMNDDSFTPAFNLRGCVFESIDSDNFFGEDIKYNKDIVLPKDSFLSINTMSNTFGVFKTPNVQIIENSETKPIYFEMTVSKEVKEQLKELGVKGYFFVRQKRIPTILGQGISFGIDKVSYAPMIPSLGQYVSEGFLKLEDGKPVLKTISDITKITSELKKSSCLISLEANVSPTLQSQLNGVDFILEKYNSGVINFNKRKCAYAPNFNNSNEHKIFSIPAIYVSEGTPYKFVGDYGFSTRFGIPEEVKQFSFFGKNITNTKSDEGDLEDLEEIYRSDKVYGGKNINLLRGIHTGIIGLCGNVDDSCCYNIRIPGYSESKNEEYFSIRKGDNSSFYAISNRNLITLEKEDIVNVFRGDCYTNTVTMRLNRNFTDPEVPLQDVIVDKNVWNKHYVGYLQMGSELKLADGTIISGDWKQINRADVNAVPLGIWFTYKCLSSNNLGLRTIDRSYVDEIALTGSERGFYPLNGMNLLSSGKVSDTNCLNLGYGATVGEKVYLPYKEVPYTKELFDNRIMFSNIQTEDEFKNGYRVFQNLAYKDIDRQYGAIIKLLPWGTDLLCVFEHGIGIVPVNQKALMSTTTGQSIHLYGSGVLQSQISLITGDYGSVWQESIIKTPIGVYGVDTYAKKIWRYSDRKGFETISDMAIQRFLNDHILLDENSNNPKIAIKNVKTHYNNYKGDVMFTFYNFDKNIEWNLCYNERLGKWITKYSWTPLYSENINNIYYSFDKKRAEILSQIEQTNNEEYGLVLKSDSNPYVYSFEDDLDNKVHLTNTTSLQRKFIIEFSEGQTSYLDENGKEIFVNLSKDDLKWFLTTNEIPKEIGDLSLNVDSFKLWWESKFTKTILKPIPTFVEKEGVRYSTSKFSKEDMIDLVNQKTLDFDVNNLFELDGYWAFIGEEIEVITTLPIDLPLWLRFNIAVKVYYDEQISSVIRNYTCCFITNYEKLTEYDKSMYDKMFINGVYVHGRAGIFNEIDYTDDSLDNQILPTKWYDKQEPFEFEFVINDPIGLHKVFETLTIISNNVAPESIQFEIEGDAYSVWKTVGDHDINPSYNKNLKKQQYKNNTLFKNAHVKWDTILNKYSILMTQECKSIENFGRRLGNMHYKEDSWYITINPLLLNKNGKTVSTKLRDKYLKVRVRYSGEDLAVITAIKSMVNLSAS